MYLKLIFVSTISMLCQDPAIGDVSTGLDPAVLSMQIAQQHIALGQRVLSDNMVLARNRAARGQASIRYSDRTRVFPRKREATGNRVFIFDPKRLGWAAYSAKGRLINTGRASGGRSYCADVGRRCLTPGGTFTVYRRGNADCVSSKFPLGRGGAPMPYCMFFYKGYAIHGSPDVPDYNASHGCIRVLPEAAKWLHENFIGNGTTVIVLPY